MQIDRYAAFEMMLGISWYCAVIWGLAFPSSFGGIEDRKSDKGLRRSATRAVSCATSDWKCLVIAPWPRMVRTVAARSAVREKPVFR
jgi:hypothetical protein